jgi:hypothetical protein
MCSASRTGLCACNVAALVVVTGPGRHGHCAVILCAVTETQSRQLQGCDHGHDEAGWVNATVTL